MGENVLTLMRFLSSAKSPLPTLTDGYTRPSTVFFTHIGGLFFIYSFATAKVMYTLLFLASFALVRATYVDPAPALKKVGDGFWREQIKGGIAVVFGAIGTLLVPNLVAVVMKYVLNKGMSWFASPLAPLWLYGPAAILGAMINYLEIVNHFNQCHPPRCLGFSIPCRRNPRTIRPYGFTPCPSLGNYRRAGGWHRFGRHILPMRTPTFCGSDH